MSIFGKNTSNGRKGSISDVARGSVSDFESRRVLFESLKEIRTDKDFSVKKKFLVKDTETVLGHGQRVHRAAVTGANGTVFASSSDYILAFTSLAFTPALVLPRPSLAGLGKTSIVKDEIGQGASTTITVSSAADELIDGAATSTITTNYGSRRYYTDGSNWFTI